MIFLARKAFISACLLRKAFGTITALLRNGRFLATRSDQGYYKSQNGALNFELVELFELFR